VEDIAVKKSFYKELGHIVKPSGILASNTSSLSIGDFAGSSGRPSHVVLFSPDDIIPSIQ
jgi:3-hydroxyacyl-CoA dehydrogenase